jgi:hypothetical protein
VDQTLTGEGHHSFLSVTPPGQGLGPLLDPSELGYLLAILNQRAIDSPGYNWRHLAGKDIDHGLVEHGQPLACPFLSDQSSPQKNLGQTEKVGITEPTTEFNSSPRSDLSFGIGALHADLLVSGCDQEVAVLSTIGVNLLAEPGDSSKPSSPLGVFTLIEEVESHPETAPNRSAQLSSVEELLMGSLESINAYLDLAEENSCDGQQLEILCGQQRLGIGGEKGGVGLLPLRAFRSMSASLECLTGYGWRPGFAWPLHTRATLAKA